MSTRLAVSHTGRSSCWTTASYKARYLWNTALFQGGRLPQKFWRLYWPSEFHHSNFLKSGRRGPIYRNCGNAMPQKRGLLHPPKFGSDLAEIQMAPKKYGWLGNFWGVELKALRCLTNAPILDPHLPPPQILGVGVNFAKNLVVRIWNHFAVGKRTKGGTKWQFGMVGAPLEVCQIWRWNAKNRHCICSAKTALLTKLVIKLRRTATPSVRWPRRCTPKLRYTPGVAVIALF